MEFIRPIQIDDAKLVSTTILEDDYPEWVSGQSYALDEYVIRTQTHRVYRCSGAVTSSTPPEEDILNWTDYGPTNAWAMFDQDVSTLSDSSAQDEVTVVISPGRVDSIALLRLQARTIDVSMNWNGEEVYSAHIDLEEPSNNTGGLFDYFFEPRVLGSYWYENELVDLAFLDMTPFISSEITITFRNPGGLVKVGEFVCGKKFYIGETQNNPRPGVKNYSVRKRDEKTGKITLQKGGSTRYLRASARLDTKDLDSVFSTLERYKDEPMVIVATSLHGSMIILGLVDWEMERQNSLITQIEITAEGVS
ncbi:hypothetical protein [Thiomicrorhabdus indica]|uniref:hypothetical protein n=1 Tax=Thiomicrorhabdus indica TaxID=2267253 RepID=UPI002AA67872|nr:hypothetical protein [Thiomicrorhabdus indica]